MEINVIRCAIPDLLILEPKVFRDLRGFFQESYNKRVFARAAGIHAEFVQDNYSRSTRGVLRGLHYQIRQPQGKLLKVVSGSVFDVAVDIRQISATFGKAVCLEISADNGRVFWIPPGFAHGFLVVSESADVHYKTTDYYAPQHERCIAWNDPDIGVPWPLVGRPILSEKDAKGVPLREAEVFQ